MIPIIYESNETAFNNNGIGRLRDCIECTVTEERNGVFECDFTYPVNGANYDLIKFGRIVGVTHDEDGDIQPFEIVSASRPINGVVSFHCVHISYRQSQMVVVANSVNSLSQAFQLFAIASPSNPFTYEADFTATGFMASSDGVPHSVRQMLGGIKGSVLDTYGGEFEWDKFTVKLHKNRGELKDFAIRYGVNLLDYDDDTDFQNTFTSCVAFWKGNDEIVTVTASLNENGYNGNDIRVPLDLSDKFEEKPTTAQLEAKALAYMNSNRTNLPSQSIRVNFVRLSEMGEFSAFQDLLKCKLCDTLKVIFPMYNVSANFKIVKTVWNVLRGSYDSMELGTLSTTLAQALGVGETTSSSSGGGADYIVETGTSGRFTFRKWASGIAECWGYTSASDIACSSQWGNGFYSALQTEAFPTDLFNATPKSVQLTLWDNGGGFYATMKTWSATDVQYYVWSPKNETRTCEANIYVIGTWDGSTPTPIG